MKRDFIRRVSKGLAPLTLKGIMGKINLFEQENPLDSTVKPYLSEQGFEQTQYLEKNPLKINGVSVQENHDLSEHLNCEMAEKSNKDKDLKEKI